MWLSFVCISRDGNSARRDQINEALAANERDPGRLLPGLGSSAAGMDKEPGTAMPSHEGREVRDVRRVDMGAAALALDRGPDTVGPYVPVNAAIPAVSPAPF